MRNRKAKEPISEERIKLAGKFRDDIAAKGRSEVVCPVCNEKPVMKTTEHGERTYIRCRCGYILDGEINL